MSRPGLVIGLGGTGQWVLTWLKRDLLQTNNGTLPGNVRLLAFDTAINLKAGATRVTASGQQEESTSVGGVTLEASEFVYLGGDSRPLAEAVSQGKFPHISQWYQANTWLSTQMPTTFILDDGAGRLRQFGRIAIFKDLLGQNNSVIWRSLNSVFEQLRRHTSERQRLEIMVVGSFAGGTGSGMFIDIALILRMIAERMGVHHIIRGYFALPSVYTTSPSRELKARTFAAWRELNRFMVTNSDNNLPTIEYVENSSEFRIHPDKRLFDACYLIDGVRSGTPLAEEAKFGAFPVISEAISAILDEKAGAAYSELVFTNLAPQYARMPDIPMYSALGTYSIQFPANFIQEISTYQFAQKFLLYLLAPQREPDFEGRLISSRTENIAAPDRNQEDEGIEGRLRSISLLRLSFSYQGKTIKPSRFIHFIGEQLQKINDNNNRINLIDQLSRGKSALSENKEFWGNHFTDIGDDPQYEAARKELTFFLSYSLISTFRRRDGEKGEEFRLRLRKVPEEVFSLFGGQTTSESEKYYGSFGDTLKICKKFQINIYCQLLRACLADILIGRSEDAIISHGGKLGYAWDFLNGLASGLSQFLNLLHEVKQRRDELQLDLKSLGINERASKFLSETSGKKFIWLFEHSDVKGAEKAYLEAQQKIIEIRREDILFLYIVETVNNMRNLASQTRDEIQRWIWHLSTGDDASNIPGLWDELRNGISQIRQAHSFDVACNKVQKLIGEEEKSWNEAEIRRALAHWQWNIEFTGEQPVFTIEATITSENAMEDSIKLINPFIEDSDKKRVDISHRNLTALLRLSRGGYEEYTKRVTVADEIKKYYPSPEEFANRIIDVCGYPLFEGSPAAAPRIRSNLIRVMADINDPYFFGKNGVEGELRRRHHLDASIRSDMYSIAVVGSENPYKLTSVQTDDLYQYDHFAAWKDCLNAYTAYLDEQSNSLNPVFMQNFAAEARAVEFESRLMRIKGTAYKPLHPHVVTLLEDPNALCLFLYLYMLGYIVEKNDGTYRWQLELEKGRVSQIVWLTRGWEQNRNSYGRSKPAFFDAMHGFVINRNSFEPGSMERVDTQLSKDSIDKKFKAMGIQKEITLLEDNLQEDGLLGFLRAKAEYQDFEQLLHQEYADLADVVEIILKDRLNELRPNSSLEMKGAESFSSDKALNYQVIVYAKPAKVSVGQKFEINIDFALSSPSKDTIIIPSDAELNCFISTEGFQIIGSEASTIHLDTLMHHPLPIQFELQALLRGTQKILIQIYVEDQSSGRVQAFQTNTEIIVAPPQALTRSQEILPSLNIQVTTQPDLVLQVISDFNANDDLYHLNYVVTSRLPGALHQNIPVGTTTIKRSDITVIRGLLSAVMELSKDMSIEDQLERINNMGNWLFDKVFPIQSASSLRNLLQQIGERIRTLLIMEDGIVWIPWEIITFPYAWKMSSSTWGERFQISRWIQGLGTTLYRDLPLGEISLAHYKQMKSEKTDDQDIIGWSRLLNAYKSYGITPVIQNETPVYALHMLYELEESKSQDIIPRHLSSDNHSKSVTDDIISNRLDLHRKRPVVTISAPHFENERFEGALNKWVLREHSLLFLRAGASAIVGPDWIVSVTTERFFWSSFYDYLGEHVKLGDAVWKSRRKIRYLQPDKPEFLAFICFGDPLAKPYLPELGDGYAVLECINPEDPLIPGKTYYFRASLRKRPPVEHTAKLIKVVELPEQLNALFLAPGLQRGNPEAIPMQPFGRYMVQAIFEVTPSRSGDYPLIVQILEGDEHLKTLQINLKVRDFPRKKGSHG